MAILRFEITMSDLRLMFVDVFMGMSHQNSSFSSASCNKDLFTFLFLKWRQPGPMKSVLLVILGWLITQFSEKGL